MPHLYLTPGGSLGNRLLALLSSMRIAEMLGMELSVLWPVDGFCAASFEHLFGNSLPVIQAMPEEIEVYSRRTPDHGHNLVLPARADGRQSFGINHYFYVITEPDLTDTGHALPQIAAQFAKLALSPLVQARLRRFQTVDFASSVGVHIRRHFDDQRFPQDRHYDRIPDERYLAVTEKIRADHGLTGPVYVASNLPSSKQAFIDRFPSALWNEAYAYTPDAEPIAVVDALIDILMLARCSVIVRSEHTTFSRVSSIVGLRPQVLLSSEHDGISMLHPGG